jgi:hypothetical protein
MKETAKSAQQYSNCAQQNVVVVKSTRVRSDLDNGGKQVAALLWSDLNVNKPVITNQIQLTILSLNLQA